MKISISRAQRGVTLIELMIGLALGLIASLAIFSTISSFEAQRRTTASGMDMQQNGLMALYSIDQDIRMAGFGLIDISTTPGSMPCSKINAYGTNSVWNSAPVVIANNASAGNDIITVNRLNSDTGGIVTGGKAAGLAANMNSGDTSISVDTSEALHTNDFILVSQANLDCSLFKVSAIPSATSVTVVNVANAIGNTTLTPTFPASGYSAAASAVIADLGAASSASAANTFGSTNPAITPTFATTKYQINTNLDLIRTEDNGTTWNTVASNIVAIAAQYGVANAGSPTVNCWTDATGTACSGSNWANPPPADVRRIKAIQVAIVARSNQPAGSCTASTQPTTWAGITANLSGIANWSWGGCYRYKVYQTIIPIRNVIWGNL
jgi:type IV pilus assembly protein PilW